VTSQLHSTKISQQKTIYTLTNKVQSNMAQQAKLGNMPHAQQNALQLFYHITCQNNSMPNFLTTDTDFFL